jgi:hypothetical protein
MKPKYKCRYKYISSETYYINPKHLRELNLELEVHTENNAYTKTPNINNLSQTERTAKYNELKEKIQSEGFKDECPIIIMPLREDGKKDKIFQGHHRLNIAIELNLPAVPVKFAF